LLLLLCYFLTPWMLFLFSLCPEVFAASVSIITYKVFVINILYIYTFNYLYLKQSSLPYLVAALYCFLSPVRFAFKLFTSSLSLLHCCWNVFFSLWSFFLSLCFAVLLVCPLCLIWVVIRFSLVLLTFLCLVLSPF